jgi:hypothetical protein
VLFAQPFTEADVLRADQVAVTPRLFANATFEGVRALYTFSAFYIRPLLQGLVAATARDQAILGLYYRLAAYLASVRRLDAPLHFQSIAAAARSAFEVGLDIELIGRDPTNASVDRLAAFTRVERYRVASRLVDFYANRPLPPDFNIARQRQVCADQAETTQVEALVLQYWGRRRNGDLNWPKHWSPFPETRGRARQVGPGWEERYVRYYYMLSWQIHSGVVGAAGLQQDSFDIFVADAHRLIRDTVIDAFGVLGRELHLAQAMNEWGNRLEFLRHVSGIALVDQRLQGLGEPARFMYLEDHEQEDA